MADNLLASPEFKRSIQAYINGNPEQANKILNASKAAKSWLNSISPEVKRQIARQGFIQYLSSDNEEK